MAGFSEWARSKFIVPPNHPGWETGVFDDVVEAFEPGEAVREDLPGTSWMVVYGGEDDDEPRPWRRLTVLALEQARSGNLSIQARCHETNSIRRFSVARIQQLANIQTGEIISPPSEIFGRSLTNGARDKLIREHETVMGRARHGIRVLIFLSHCDGHVCADEEEVMMQYVAFRAEQGTAPLRFHEDWARSWIQKQTADAELAITSLARLIDDGDPHRLEELAYFLHKLIGADGEETAAEFEAAVMLRAEIVDLFARKAIFED